MKNTDIMVVGGGPGGTPAAMALASAGRRVVLVNDGPGLGGTCLFEGCIPSKIFRETAHRYREAQAAGAFGITLPEAPAGLDWPVVMKRKQEILTKRSHGALQKAQSIPSLDVVQGKASLTGPREALIAPADGQPYPLRFERAILATGSRSHLPPLPGMDLPGVLTSESILSIDHVPESLTVIGGGPIGMEMAHIFQGLGTRITVLEMLPHILGPVDDELAGQIERMSRDRGIEVHTSVSVESIVESADGLKVTYEEAGASRSVLSECVLAVTGRRPAVEELGLEHTTVQHDHSGVCIDEHLETGEPGIFAVGDVVGQPMFAHWATAQALALVNHLLGRPAPFPKPAINTAVIFTMPEVGIAGLTKAEAEREGLEVETGQYPYAIDARAQIGGQSEGMLKFVFERDSGRVVGVHMLAEGAGDLMGEAALIVRKGFTLVELATTIHPHPTLNESFGFLARSVLAQRAARTTAAGTVAQDSREERA